MTDKPAINLTPMLRQYLEMKERFKSGILFFRMGDFYEMFYDDATTASEVLEIVLTKRNDIPMCGIPYHAKDNYIPKLLHAGYKIGICEQIEDPKLAKGIVKRDIVEIITPGTIVDDKITGAQAVIVLCFAILENRFACSYMDITTGDFYGCEETTDTPMSMLHDEIARLAPKELLIPDWIVHTPAYEKDLRKFRDKLTITPYPDVHFQENKAFQTLTSELKVENLKGFGIDQQILLVRVAGALLRYVQSIQLKEMPHIKKITPYSLRDFLLMNETAIKHLELFQPLNPIGKPTTLYSVLKKTTTNMGHRLLFHDLSHPLCSVKKIKQRQEWIKALLEDIHLVHELRQLMKGIGDIERIAARIALQKIVPREMVVLKKSLLQTQKIKAILQEIPRLESIHQSFLPVDAIISMIDKALVDDPPNSFEEGGIIKEEFHKELDETRQMNRDGKQLILDLEVQEKKKTAVPNLRIRFNKVIGYYIEVSKGNAKLVPDYYIRRQTLTNAERFTLPELTDLESKISGAKEKMVDLEKELFEALRKDLLVFLETLKHNAFWLARLDVCVGLAFLAHQHNYVCPIVDESHELVVQEGRHPVVETYLEKGNFIPNDLYLNRSDSQLIIITGPNMAGKSTFLRQSALIVIMAQLGSYVPASYAKIGLVDKIFTRIGASDNLAMGESTFLVEMSETANILNNATTRSLIIMDEIGRGTSTYDGLSIAWSIVEYLTDSRNQLGKVLFATHFHELSVLEKIPGIRNFQILVKEWEGNIVFMHKVEPGIGNKSYGIQVAKLAGIPHEVIDRAFVIMNRLMDQQSGKESHFLPPNRVKANAIETDQLYLFEEISDMDPIHKEVLHFNANQTDPNKLLAAIKRWQQQLRKQYHS